MIQPKLWQRDMKFGTWNIRSLYRSKSFTTVAREFARYKLGLLVVQQGRWDKGSTVRVGFFFIISIEEGTKIISWKQDNLYSTLQSSISS